MVIIIIILMDASAMAKLGKVSSYLGLFSCFGVAVIDMYSLSSKRI